MLLFFAKKFNLYTIAACSSFHSLSITIVPNGSKEAMNALASHFKFFPYSARARNARIINPTNKTPCNPPMMVTAIGMPTKYLRGIAISKRIRKEIPSANATLLNAVKIFFDFIVAG